MLDQKKEYFRYLPVTDDSDNDINETANLQETTATATNLDFESVLGISMILE